MKVVLNTIKQTNILPQSSWVFEFCNKLFVESYWTMNLLNFIFELSNETTYLLSSEIMRLDYNYLLIFIWCHDEVSLAWIFFRSIANYLRSTLQSGWNFFLLNMTFITPFFLTDVSSEILEQLQELKEQVGALGAAREWVNSKFCFKTIE